MFVAGSGDKTGKTISLSTPFLSPATGPTTKMFGFSLLYGWTKRPFVLAFISGVRRSFGASWKPSGRIKTEPTLIVCLLPSPPICLTEVS